jgi:hypothetical protein
MRKTDQLWSCLGMPHHVIPTITHAKTGDVLLRCCRDEHGVRPPVERQPLTVCPSTAGSTVESINWTAFSLTTFPYLLSLVPTLSYQQA